MKKVIGIFAIGLILIGFKKQTTIQIGDALPSSDIAVVDVDGNETTLAKQKKDKGLLVMFSCNTCPYVLKNQSRTIDIAKLAISKDIGVVILNSNEALRDDKDSKEAMKKYATAQGYTWTYAIDANSVIADAFGAARTPECFLFDSDLKLVYKGAIDDNPNDAAKVEQKHLANGIEALAEGKPLTVKESRSVGCSIKRKS